MAKVLVICGATASGKTSLSVACAKAFNGEIISADSLLVYKGLNIGTAKPTMAEREGIPHYMIDVVEPTESFSVSDEPVSSRSTATLSFFIISPVSRPSAIYIMVTPLSRSPFIMAR